MPRRPISFNDWNDLHIVLTVAEHRGFARAAKDLGVDQTTVARRISDIETALGRRLFKRRTSGAEPTELCQEILTDAISVAAAVRRVEERLEQARTQEPHVTVGASQGLLTYTIVPAFRGSIQERHPIDVRRLRQETFPPLKFTNDLKAADVSIWLASERALPPIRGAYQVRRLGTIEFRSFASKSLVAQENFSCETFDDLQKHPLFDIKLYSQFNSLDDWNGLCAGHSRYRLFNTTPDMKVAAETRKAVVLYPTYAPMYDDNVVPLDISAPRMPLSLWLSSHEDSLRERHVRKVYDALGDAFEQSSWFH